MITEKPPEHQPKTWQKLLAEAIRDPVELIELLELNPKGLKGKMVNPHHFPLRVPRGFANKMRRGDWKDPLLRQVLPLEQEQDIVTGFSTDPVGDLNAIANNSKGVLKKYNGRALIITTGACAIHCRYCFRQNFPYSKHRASDNEWSEVITNLSSDSSINEVILSGGDPLNLSDRRLSSLCFQLETIPHIKVLRLHTRLPVVLPERIDDNFLTWFQKLSIKKVMVIHANHANEFCLESQMALNRLHQAKTVLLNQSVLLKGVNDDLKSLIDLSHQLLENQVIPYYLHLLDHVQGAARFDHNEQTAIELIEQLRHHLPGYLVPKLVREVSGKRSKTPIN